MSGIDKTPSSAVTSADEALRHELQTLGEKLLGMAKELSGATVQAKRLDAAEQVGNQVNDKVIAGIALAIYRARQRRYGYFKQELLGEPAWDILLDAFISKLDGRHVSSTSLGLAAAAPLSTASRTIRRLEADGLLRSYTADNDKRLRLVEITPVGLKLMRSYLSDGILKDEMPLPKQFARA